MSPACCWCAPFVVGANWRCGSRWAHLRARSSGNSLMEGMLLSGAGGLLGLLLAAVTLQVAVPLLPESMPRVDGIHLDMGVIFFALVPCAPHRCALRHGSGIRRHSHARERKPEGRRQDWKQRLQPRTPPLRARRHRDRRRPGSADGRRSLCCAASRRCATSIPASAPTMYWSPDTTCPRSSTPHRARVDAFDRTLLERLEAMPGTTPPA